METIRIQLISDLHVEHHGIHSVPSAAELDADVDIVVFAGDTAHAHDAVHVARRLSDAAHIVMVAGNHEFYAGSRIDDGIRHMKAEATRLSEPASAIHVLENEAAVINVRGQQVRILGATLWTDFTLYGTPNRSAGIVGRGLNDFIYSSGTDGSEFTTDECIERHQASRRSLAGALAMPFDGPTVVATHHLPSARCVSPRFVGDELSPGFASDCGDLVGLGATLWCYGHTHDSGQLREAGGTLVVGNPAGYARRDGDGWLRENADFDPRLVVRLSTTTAGWRADRE